jgi:hypothetical protein
MAPSFDSEPSNAPKIPLGALLEHTKTMAPLPDLCERRQRTATDTLFLPDLLTIQLEVEKVN